MNRRLANLLIAAVSSVLPAVSQAKKIISIASPEDEHTAQQCRRWAWGRGGFMSNAGVFKVTMANFGWDGATARR